MTIPRETLELAAKAVGIRYVKYDYANQYDGKLGLMLLDDAGKHVGLWNPCLDGNDAGELAGKLGMRITFCSPTFGVALSKGITYLTPAMVEKSNE